MTSIFQVLFRSQKRPSVVIFLDHSIKDISRFCIYNAPSNFFGPLSADDTYSVANYYLVQTVYQNLSVVQRDTLKSSWFPGPCSFVRQTGEEEHRLVWQVAERANSNLVDLRELGTDDDKAIYNAILGECDCLTQHILGLEHVRKNNSDKLKELHFLNAQTKNIMDDIFVTLYDCETNDYDELVTVLKKKWLDIESKHSKSEGQGKFVQYFEKSKQLSFKNKLIKSARNRAYLSDDYLQNPVEWSNYLIKDERRKKLGTVKTVSITDTVQVLKERNIHLYSNACKAIYNHGPYKLSAPFKHFQRNYNEWFSLNRKRKEQHLRRFFSYVLSENDVAGEGIDAETNEDLEETLGVFGDSKKASYFFRGA